MGIKATKKSALLPSELNIAESSCDRKSHAAILWLKGLLLSKSDEKGFHESDSRRKGG